MKRKPSGRRRAVATAPQKRVSKRSLDRARAGLFTAADSAGWVQAAFRLMLTAAPGAFASAALRCTRSDAALWISSNGFHVHSAEMPAMMADHPGIHYLRQHPGQKVLPTRGVLPPQEVLETTPFYREFMAPSGWRHAVGLCFWHKGEPPPLLDCVLSVHRRADEGDFTDAEIAALGALHAEIDAARERVTAIEEARAALSSFEHFVAGLPVPVALLSWDLASLYHNRLARECCALWQEGAAVRRRKIPRAAFAPPPAILAACREMQAEWRERIRADSQGECVLARAVSAGGASGLKATVRLLFLTGATLGHPNFMIQFEPPPLAPHAGSAAADAAHHLPKLLGLTPAEQNVALRAAALKSNQEIADEIGRSVGTVKAELHGAYKKLGVRTRAELALLFNAPPGASAVKRARR